MLRRSVVSMFLFGLAACTAAPGGAGSGSAGAAPPPQRGASLVGTRWVGEAGGGVDGAALPRLEHALGFQRLDRLAQHRAADTEFRQQLGLWRQQAARLVQARDDAPADLGGQLAIAAQGNPG